MSIDMISYPADDESLMLSVYLKISRLNGEGILFLRVRSYIYPEFYTNTIHTPSIGVSCIFIVVCFK